MLAVYHSPFTPHGCPRPCANQMSLVRFIPPLLGGSLSLGTTLARAGLSTPTQPPTSLVRCCASRRTVVSSAARRAALASARRRSTCRVAKGQLRAMPHYQSLSTLATAAVWRTRGAAIPAT
jgi:hypothetical protein